MKVLEYTVRFVTPAFLGSADQSAQWRTPPFKALLRQWWRVAAVAGQRPDLKMLRQREGELFGRAADEGTTASQVRLRLDWRGGTDKSDAWKGLAKVAHPEVPHEAGADLYLGYGPIDVGSKLKRASFIPADGARAGARGLSVGVPDAEESRFRDAARLIHAFGTLGSRSRNGWGSLHFDEDAKDRALTAQELAAMLDPANCSGREWLRRFSRDWKQALDTDWRHAVGRDEMGLLLWRTEALAKWEDVLKTLAEVKIAFRTQFHFKGGGKHAALCDRQLLAYPITSHELWDWEFVKDEKTGRPRKESSRNANQLLFKVLPANGGYVGLVGHFAHGLPNPLVQRLSPADQDGLNDREQRVWTDVHRALDKRLTRLP